MTYFCSKGIVFASSEIRTLFEELEKDYECRCIVLTGAGKAFSAGTLYQSYWAWSRENMISLHANNKGSDQPVLPHSLISAIVIHFLQSLISKLATDKFQYLS